MYSAIVLCGSGGLIYKVICYVTDCVIHRSTWVVQQAPLALAATRAERFSTPSPRTATRALLRRPRGVIINGLTAVAVACLHAFH